MEPLGVAYSADEAASQWWGYDRYHHHTNEEEAMDGGGWWQQQGRSLHRWLKDDEEETVGFRMDYSVLSVAVMTLGLIMVVEVFIHRLDHAAAGRPYFTAVLENIYNECKCAVNLN
jgi:hypothetical protein